MQGRKESSVTKCTFQGSKETLKATWIRKKKRHMELLGESTCFNIKREEETLYNQQRNQQGEK